MSIFQPDAVSSVNGMTGDVVIATGGISDPGANGILSRTALNTASARTITGTTNQVTVTNGDGVAGNPTLSLPQNIHTGASPSFTGISVGGAANLRPFNIKGSGFNARFSIQGTTTADSPGVEFTNDANANRALIRMDSVSTTGTSLNFWTESISGSIDNRLIIDASGNTTPGYNNNYTLGTSSLYWKETYTNKLFLNSTATLDGSTAGEIKGTGVFTADNIKRGTGFPEGVVTANVGTIYVDTAITNGASSWIKKSGTGNTGWQVLEGDTGWRRNDPANSWFLNGATPNADGDPGTRFRRYGNVVHFILGLTTPSGWTNGADFLAVPNGFRHPNTLGYMPGGYSTASSMAVVSTGTTMRFYSGVISTARFQWTWITNDPWPTTLPGIAA